MKSLIRIMLLLSVLVVAGCTTRQRDHIRVFIYGNAADWAYPEGDYEYGDEPPAEEQVQPLLEVEL